MHTLLSLGHDIPGDGADWSASTTCTMRVLLPVPLTTLRQPCREIGIAAMAAMLERVTRPAMPARDIFLQTPLIVRRSCGAGGSASER